MKHMVTVLLFVKAKSIIGKSKRTAPTKRLINWFFDIEDTRGRVHIKYLIDFAALFFLYAFVFFKKWKSRGRDVLIVNTLMYIYLSFVLFFTLMPIITSIPFILNHPYTPMNLITA